jgi:hypothetical protein
MTNPTLERAERAVEDATFNELMPGQALIVARAVLMAVREMPAETQAAIFDARDGFVHKIDIPAVWQSGIDAILNDGESE